MKNKFKHEQITAGMLIAVNTCDDGNVYAVLTQHQNNEFVYLLAQKQNGKVVNCGWLDYTLFYKPTKQQMAHPDNQWVKNYQSN